MAEEARCEGEREVEVTQQPGKSLPPEWERCTDKAAYLVKRPFSGITTSLCKSHTRRYHKMERLGLVKVTELKEET